jgi:hypothetical protein
MLITMIICYNNIKVQEEVDVMSEIYDKKLERNYGKVQKSELKYFEKKDKGLSSYDRKLKAIAASTKKESKQQSDQEKQIKLATKNFIQHITKLDKEKTKNLNIQIKDAKTKLKDDVDNIETTYKEKANDFSEEKKTISTTYTTVKRDEAKKSKTSQSSFAAKEKRTVKRFEGMKQKEQIAVKERKKQAEETIKILQTERDELVKEISDTSQKEINSAYEVIAFRRAKIDENLELAQLKHNELIEGIDKEENGATSKYNSNIQKNEQSLEEKVNRRNKFLQKADLEGDFKNVKLQKREIKQLEQASEKELKQFKMDFDKLIKEIELKRTVEERRFLEEVAEIERGFAQFKQEQLWRIELVSLESAEEITNIKLETEKKLYAETHILEQVDIDFEVELARLEREKQIAINEIKDMAEKDLIAYERARDQKEVEFDMHTALNEKESKIAQYKKEIEKNNLQSKFEIQEVEFEIELQLQEEELQFKVAKQMEEEFIGLHKNDFEKQTAIREEHSSTINELSEVHLQRAQDQLEFEELEIENRVSLKLKFLDEQKSILEKEYKLLLDRIETNQKQEESFYKAAIKQIEKQEKDILKKTVAQEQKEIKKLEQSLAEIETEGGEADSSAITSRLQELIDVVSVEMEDTQKIIRTKVAVVEEMLSLIQSRQQLEKDDAKVLYNREIRNLEYGIELVEQNKQSELLEAKARYEKTVDLYKGLKQDIASKLALKKEEHVQFLSRREEYEKNILSAAKERYDQAVQLLEETKARKITSIKDGLHSENSVLNKLIESENDAYKALQKESVHKKIIIHNSSEARLLDRSKTHLKTIEEIESDYLRILANRERELKQKDIEFKGLLAQVEKSIQVEKKKYEDDRRKAQKTYEIELKKSITSINKNLELESRLV